MKKKILSLLLALTLCLGLAVPALAADAPHDVDLTSLNEVWLEWGDQLPAGSKLTVNGVIGQEPYEDALLFDVVVGGGYTMDTDVSWEVWFDAVLNGESADPYLYAPWMEDDWRYNGKYVFTCTEEMLSKPGAELVFGVHLDGAWMAPGSDLTSITQADFYLRVNEAPSSTIGFSDVKDSDYFSQPVAWAVENKITNGTGGGMFSPAKTCNQGEILTFLWRAKNQPEPTGSVSGTKFYAKASQWAEEQGIIDGAFAADAPCTRAMVVDYLWKLAGSPKTGSANFSDVPAGSAQAVAWAVEQKITNGTGGGKFSPDKTCTRGEIVTFLYRALA